MGEIISQKRKEAGLTQAELAKYVGVSKPAVSKWESGHTLPDITLLPVLASFFDISIDELMGYQPQMTEKNIDKLYKNLVDKLSKTPADEVFTECRKYINKYYFCWNLILKMSALMCTHYQLSSEPQNVLQEVIAHTERLCKQCDDKTIFKGAKYIQTCCLAQLGEFEKAEESAESLIEPVINIPVFLSVIYYEQGKKKDAEQIILSYIEQNLQLIFSAIPNCCMYSENSDVEYRIQKFQELLRLFDAEKNYPENLLYFYYTSAIAYCNLKKSEKALEYFRKSIILIEKIKNNTQIHHGFFKNAFHKNIKTEFDENRFNLKMILENAIVFLSKSDTFNFLKDNQEFKNILEKLKKVMEEHNE